MKAVHALGLCELLPRLVGARILAGDFRCWNLPVWWGARHSERMGNTTSSPGRCRLRIKDGFAVVDRQQRRLHDRTRTLGFTDLDSYLVARCQADASLTRLAGELHTTIDVIRRLVDEAGIPRSSPKVRSARQRRRTTDQHRTRRPARLPQHARQSF